jgi:hypothetical protein
VSTGSRRPSIRIVSGGQTGVDRAALDVALENGITCGGWIPRGRRAEDGVLDARYPLRETSSPAYAERTRRNVHDSNGTLVLCRGEPTGGTALTVACARDLRRPLRIVDLAERDLAGEADPESVRDWLARHRIAVLNVAGPRESGCPGIYDEAAAFLRRVLAGW